MSFQSTKKTSSSRLHLRPASSPSPSQHGSQDTPDPDQETPAGSNGGYFLDVGSGAEDGTPTPEPLEAPDEWTGPEPTSDRAEADMDTAVSNEMSYLPPPNVQPRQAVAWNAQLQGAQPEGLQQQWYMYEYGQGYPPSPGSAHSSIDTPALTEDGYSSSRSVSLSDMSFEENQGLWPPSAAAPEPSLTGTHSSVTSDSQLSLDGQPVTSRSNSRSTFTSSLSSSSTSWTGTAPSISSGVQSPQLQDGLYRTSLSQSSSLSSLAVPQPLSMAGTLLIPYAVESGCSYSWAGARSASLSTASAWSSPGQCARSLAPSPSLSSPTMYLDHVLDTALHREHLRGDRDERMSEESLPPSLEASSSSGQVQAGGETSVSVRAPVLAIPGPSHRRCSACSDSGPRYSSDCPCDNSGEDFARQAELIRHADGRFQCDWRGCRSAFQNPTDLNRHRRMHISDQSRYHRMRISSLEEPGLSYGQLEEEQEEEEQENENENERG